MTSIGERISHIRKMRGYTQIKLAKLADISVQFLSDIENGKKSMTVATLKHIAESLDVTTDYIITGKETGHENCKIYAMLDALSDKNKKKAEKILETFIEVFIQ
jgi:transcriptional regulator, XRE family